MTDVLNTITPFIALSAAAGAAWGLVADRLAARWPAHEDGRVRPADWRTVVAPAFGASAFGALAGSWHEPRDLVVLGAYVAALVLLLATDLDQRLLPDVVTLPLIPAALVVLLLGWDPLLADKQLGVVSGVAAGLAYPLLLLGASSVFKGDLGMGDAKLLVSVGLLAGLVGLLRGLLAASVVFGVILVVLLATRRITLKSHIPFGPMVILAAVLAATQG